MLGKLGELLSDFLDEFRWFRRVFFILLFVALFALDWLTWTTAGIVTVSWLLYEAMDYLPSGRDSGPKSGD